ncbi:flagellar biosynthetic protein FliQ [Roseiconus lacunae]|uniref:Flagellar biosynthetic protein FliQ n=1 Tax=Roseiconus lacunae TaxID=2605694 RepID=A0ABT7PDC8_9BACT|nr:flagellar biosynthetic protein FliQ [Roseiconus lacunae]MCD0459812.1 flagellar biosynthetic protein FliQ [Roseiconus lacunae]MDM4014510.1 flagellar biosynthetic protein FliQ [Roseiconus lacunae]WRQ49823.1 flagellar biosynthetic protein FliQ [Stieleria sp. HD01]
MEIEDAVFIGREFFALALLLTTPVVAVSLIVGLLISIGQTVTSIQEQTLSFAPRIIAVVFVLMFLATWYLQTLQNYTAGMITQMVDLIR